jgi:hypothetical protein
VDCYTVKNVVQSTEKTVTEEKTKMETRNINTVAILVLKK